MIKAKAELLQFKPTLLRQIHAQAPPGAVDLSLGQPQLAPPPSYSAAAAAATTRWARYSPNLGLPELRAAVAERYHRAAREIALTAGAQQALFMATFATLRPGDEVLVPDPGFPIYAMLAQLCGAKVRTYPLHPAKGFELCPEDLLQALSPATRMVVFNLPGNPIGHASFSTLARLISELDRREILILSDEVYGPLSQDLTSSALPSQCARELQLEAQLLVVSSLSKSHALMGWRLGWLLAPPAFIDALVPLQQMLLTCAPTPAQHAALCGGLDTPASLLATLARRRELAIEGLSPLASCPISSNGALYLFVDVREWQSDELALAYRLLEHGVVTVPGRAFGPAGAGFLRLSFGPEEAAIRAGVQRILEAHAATR